MTNNHHVVSARKEETMKAQHIEGAVAPIDFGQQFESSPKASERQMAAITVAMLSGSAA